ncbi:MAG: DUF2905 domain-containing protein [Bryobacterales bacterium]|jgi:hypothetical protein|nr:DUF2905 domain-containing protein [Bryobacterales bacterium]
MGRMLIIAGLVLLAAGLAVTFADKLPLRLGRLPGDFEFRGRNSVFYFPLATSLLLSAVLTLLLWLFRR